MPKNPPKNKSNSAKRKTPERTFTEEETLRSTEGGRRYAAALLKAHSRDYPTIMSYKLDKGDNVLNPMADKRLGLKRQEDSRVGSKGVGGRGDGKNKRHKGA